MFFMKFILKIINNYFIMKEGLKQIFWTRMKAKEKSKNIDMGKQMCNNINKRLQDTNLLYINSK